MLMEVYKNKEKISLSRGKTKGSRLDDGMMMQSGSFNTKNGPDAGGGGGFNVHLREYNDFGFVGAR